MKNKKLRIVMLCEQGFSSRVMYNALSPHYAIECVIIENKPSVKVMLGRFNKLGILRTVGQLLFLAFNKIILARASLTKNKELISKYNLAFFACISLINSLLQKTRETLINSGSDE